ncbi:MAG: hypothetical protein MJ087_05055 [Lachnospiraceae bacterium]|nr:hypothetical protein [Lachnospiraceae bacterium]
MFRMWGKIMKSNRLVKDTVIEIPYNPDMSRTAKVFDSLEKICYEFDLSNPIWLESTKKDFMYHSKCRFYSDNFIEEIDFDYLEMQVLEEEY